MADYNRNFTQMSTKKLLALLEAAIPSEEDTATIKAIIKARQDAMHGLENRFTVIKHVGKNDKFVVREFNSEDKAKKFVDLLRESEQLDIVKYSIAQSLEY